MRKKVTVSEQQIFVYCRSLKQLVGYWNGMSPMNSLIHWKTKNAWFTIATKWPMEKLILDW